MSSSSAPKIQHFILVFDRRAGHLQDQLDFGGDAKSALAKYEELEELYRRDVHMDIVLVGSDSIDTVRVTHANYFDGTARDRFADILSIAR